MNSDGVVDRAGVESDGAVKGARATSDGVVDETRLISDDAVDRPVTEAERGSSDADADGTVSLGLDTVDASLEGSGDVVEIAVDVGEPQLTEANR